jgi:hypothetical protein
MADTDWVTPSSSYTTGSSADSSTVSGVKNRVQQAASRLSRSAADAVDASRSTAAARLQSTAETLRSASHRIPGGPKVQQFASRTADGLDRTGRYLRDRQARDMWVDIQEGAKTRPVPFLVGALALGFVAGRMMRRG